MKDWGQCEAGVGVRTRMKGAGHMLSLYKPGLCQAEPTKKAVGGTAKPVQAQFQLAAPAPFLQPWQICSLHVEA